MSNQNRGVADTGKDAYSLGPPAAEKVTSQMLSPNMPGLETGIGRGGAK